MGIVEAAHIIPHSHEKSKDTIQNGIALCKNHHKMFDDGLLALDESLSVKVNYNRIEYLELIKLGYGSNEVLGLHGATLKLPINKDLHPLKENIKVANIIRGVDWE